MSRLLDDEHLPLVVDGPAKGGARGGAPAAARGAPPLKSPALAPGKKKAAREEAKVCVDKSKCSFARVDKAGLSVKSGQGRTWWTCLVTAPTVAQQGPRRSCKFEFSEWESPAGAVGMLPASASAADVSDWLGWQSASVALWLDGSCRQNSRLLRSTAPIDVAGGARGPTARLHSL
jgi:hypothetical protein